MKNWFYLSMAFALLPLSMMAQDDDMYFGSAKKQKSTYRSASSWEPVSPAPVYHTGSKRGVDEYNRRGNSYDVLPQDSDIIDFSAVEGVYPDSTADYSLTKKMARWEGYTPKQAYWEGYYDGSHDSWYWHSPWYYTSFYPWYDSWYYPYGWHYSWYYDPWYYDYYSWHWGYYPYHYYSYYDRPYIGYYHGGSRYYGTGNTGTLNRNGNYSRSTTGGRVANYTSSARFDGARNRAYNSGSGRSTVSGNTNRSTTRSTTRAVERSTNRTATRATSGSYSSSSNYDAGRAATFQSGNGGSFSSSSSSFGGNRSSGGFSSGGGTRSAGGGGGGRSGGGRR